MSVVLRVRKALARIPAMFLTAVLASVFGWCVAYRGSPRVGGPFFESLLPLVYTVPAVGIAYFGLLRSRAPKAAQVADSIRDKEWRRLLWFASLGIVFLGFFSVGTGLRYSSSSFTVAADSPTRLAAWIMVVSSLVGASALVQALAVYRRGLDPQHLALRLRDDFRSAAVTDVHRSTQRAEDLGSMALLSAEQGRVADFVEFVEALASLHLTDAVPSTDPDPLSERVDDLILRIAESVSNRADLFDKAADAVVGRLDRADEAAGIAKRVPAFFKRVRGSGAEIADSLARIINKSVTSAAEGFWNSILIESITRDVEEEVWKAVRDAAAVDWRNDSARMAEDDLAAVVGESLASANIGSSAASVVRLVQLLLAMNQGKPIESHDVTKILASNFRLIAEAVPTESSVSIFEMVLKGKWDDAAWALRRYDQLLTPDVRLICHLELHLAAGPRVPSADATRHFLAASDFNLQLQACKAILSRRSGDASGVNKAENVLLGLVRLFSTQSLGHVPVIAQFIEERLQAYGSAPLRSEVSPQDWKNLSLSLGFSEPQQDNWRIRTVAPAGEVATLENPPERQGSLDQVVSALEQIVDSFEGPLEAWDSTDSSLPPDVAPGWDVCLLLLLEIYRTHELDVEVADLLSRLLVHFESFETFYDSLSEKTRRALPKYAENLLPELLKDGFSPLRFSRALASGTIAILVGSALRASERRPSSNIAYDRDECAERIVSGVRQPQAHVEADPLFLGEVLFYPLTSSLSKVSPHAPDEPPEQDSRKGLSDLCSRLLTSMQFPTGDRLADEQEFRAWSHLLIAYMDSTPPSTTKGKARTKQALIGTAVVLDAIDRHRQLEGSESSSIEPVLVLRDKLQSALQSWLAQGRDVDSRRKLLGRALHVRTDADLPSDGGEQDRYRIDKLLARELSQACIGVMPAVTGGLEEMWRGSDDDLLAWICGWIRPPTGMPSEPDDAEIAARATITFLDAFATAADIGEDSRRALLVGLTRHFASQASRRVLFDHLPQPLEQELLIKVLRVVLDAGSSSNRIHSQSKEFEAIRSAYEYLRDLSQGDPHKIQDIHKKYEELARSQ